VHEECVTIHNLVAVQRVLQCRDALYNVVDEPAAAAAAAVVVSACTAAKISNQTLLDSPVALWKTTTK
jgi:hypothetical protein